jgi:hypothetical protein
LECLNCLFLSLNVCLQCINCLLMRAHDCSCIRLSALRMFIAAYCF